MNDYIQRRLEEFDELSTKLITRGGLSVLMDYPPHDQVLDDKAVKAFLSTSIHQAEQEMLKRVVEKINEAKKGYVGQQYRYGKEALDDLLASLDKALPTNPKG